MSTEKAVLHTVQARSDPPSKPPRKHPNTKRTGELAEAAFVVKAASLGFAVSKPWGDSERYDFILDAGHRTFRVQIKCTESPNANGYQVQSTYTDRKQKGHYTPADIDVLVAYILPLNLWYVVPAHAFPASASLRFYPDGNISGRRPRFEQYREAWHLFQQESVGPGSVGPGSVGPGLGPGQAERSSAARTLSAPPSDCHPDPELAEGEGPAGVGPGLRPGQAEQSSTARTPPDPGPLSPDPQPATDAPAPETPMERMMTQWAQRVHSLYNRKR